MSAQKQALPSPLRQPVASEPPFILMSSCSTLPNEAAHDCLLYLINPHQTCTSGVIHTGRVESDITNGSSFVSYIVDVSWVDSTKASLL